MENKNSQRATNIIGRELTDAQRTAIDESYRELFDELSRLSPKTTGEFSLQYVPEEAEKRNKAMDSMAKMFNND